MLKLYYLWNPITGERIKSHESSSFWLALIFGPFYFWSKGDFRAGLAVLGVDFFFFCVTFFPFVGNIVWACCVNEINKIHWVRQGWVVFK